MQKYSELPPGEGRWVRRCSKKSATILVFYQARAAKHLPGFKKKKFKKRLQFILNRNRIRYGAPQLEHRCLNIIVKRFAFFF